MNPISLATGGGDLGIDTGAGGNDSFATGEKTKVNGDRSTGSFGGSVENVNIQFMPRSSGSSALDMAAGFFKDTQPQTAPVIQAKTQQTAVYAVGAGLVLLSLVLLLRGRK